MDILQFIILYRQKRETSIPVVDCFLHQCCLLLLLMVLLHTRDHDDETNPLQGDQKPKRL